MGIEQLIVAVLGLTDSIFQQLNIKAQRKYLDLWFDNEEEIRAERAKWPNSDDPKLENLYAKKVDIVKAAQTELQMAVSKK